MPWENADLSRERRARAPRSRRPRDRRFPVRARAARGPEHVRTADEGRQAPGARRKRRPWRGRGSPAASTLTRFAAISPSAWAVSGSSEASRHDGRHRPSARRPGRGRPPERSRRERRDPRRQRGRPIRAGRGSTGRRAPGARAVLLGGLVGRGRRGRRSGGRELVRKHRRAHSGIDDADYLIAATALLLEADLLTTNVRHFPMLSGLQPPY